MKEESDLIRGLLRKAESDLLALDATLTAGAYDAAALHAQQAVEKLLKAFLASEDVEFPFTHNLSRVSGFEQSGNPETPILPDMLSASPTL